MLRTIFYRIVFAVGIVSAIGMLIVFGPLIAMPLSFCLGAGVGGLIAECVRCVPELRVKCLSKLALVVVAMVLTVYVSNFGGFGAVTGALAAVGLLLMLLAPNLSHFGASRLVGFMDRQDWSPSEEDIALRPIRLLIDRDNYRQALGELDELFKTHNPTYEAVLLKARLLNHIGRVDEARSALLSLITLSKSTPQQLAVMEMLSSLEENYQETPNPPAPGTRSIEIHHELVLFKVAGDDPSLHKEILPGAYEVAEIMHRNRRWLKLAGEDFGNDEMCWEAILGSIRPASAPAKKGLLWNIARAQQSGIAAIIGTPHRQKMAESRDFFREANEFLRREDWQNALPLLQKASANNPDRFEIAYRWVQVVRQTSNDAATAEVLNKVLAQSQWSKSEADMLKQLQRPPAK